jgi:hypothetical protein
VRGNLATRVEHVNTEKISLANFYTTVAGSLPLTASAAARGVWSVTAAYRRIIRSVFHPPSAITIGAVKPRLTTRVVPIYPPTNARRPRARLAAPVAKDLELSLRHVTDAAGQAALHAIVDQLKQLI